MNNHSSSQSSFASGSYPAQGQAPLAYPPGGYGTPPGFGAPGEFGMPGGVPPGQYPPGYNPWLGTFAGPRYASVWSRVGAYFIDGIILAVINTVAQLMFVAVSSNSLNSDDTGTALTALLAYVLLVFVLDAIYIVSQEATCGQTLGKRALGIKVVKADGSQMDVDAALIRYLFLFFAFVGFGGLVTLLMVSLSDTKQRLGDRVAGTIVVRAR